MLFVDLVESVRLVQADPEGTIGRWRRFERQVRDELLPRLDGHVVKLQGDGMMLDFDRPSAAAAAALQIHRLIGSCNTERPPHLQMVLRMGADVGPVVVCDGDDLGHPSNIAARLCHEAPMGKTLISAALRDELVPGPDGDLEDLGELTLKHVDHPVRAFCLHDGAPTPLEMPRGPLGTLTARVAVIPFDVMSEPGSLSLLGEAAADELLHVLSRHPALTTISRLSSSAFRGRAGDLAAIRAHLLADLAVSGRLHVSGDRLRLLVEVVEVRSAAVVWSGSAAGGARDMFSGTDSTITELARSICDALSLRQVERARREPMAALENYCLLMAAVKLLHGASRPDFDRARAMLEHLIERDRRHAAPHAWLAKWHVLCVQQGWHSDMRTEARLAQDCARRALDRDPRSALSMAIDGFVHCNLLKDVDGAVERYEMALAENPNESLAWLFLGTVHAFKGEGVEAMKAADHALILSPLDPMRYFFESLSATAALSAGQWERAIERARHSLRLNRMHTSTLRVITIAQVQLGRMDEARATAAALLRLEPKLTVAAYRDRSPSTGFATGKVWSESLALAGVPAA